MLQRNKMSTETLISDNNQLMSELFNHCFIVFFIFDLKSVGCRTKQRKNMIKNYELNMILRDHNLTHLPQAQQTSLRRKTMKWDKKKRRKKWY